MTGSPCASTTRFGRGDVAFERQRRVLNDADAVAVLLQQAVDVLPAGAIDEAPVDENDRARFSHDALLQEVERGDSEPRSRRRPTSTVQCHGASASHRSLGLAGEADEAP
jgi:hypothetical protein